MFYYFRAVTSLYGMGIEICTYNKSQGDALFLKFVFYKEHYRFRKDLLSIIRSLNTVHTVADSFSVFVPYDC